jgi:hypothetical protein
MIEEFLTHMAHIASQLLLDNYPGLQHMWRISRMDCSARLMTLEWMNLMMTSLEHWLLLKLLEHWS